MTPFWIPVIVLAAALLTRLAARKLRTANDIVDQILAEEA